MVDLGCKASKNERPTSRHSDDPTDSLGKKSNSRKWMKPTGTAGAWPLWYTRISQASALSCNLHVLQQPGSKKSEELFILISVWFCSKHNRVGVQDKWHKNKCRIWPTDEGAVWLPLPELETEELEEVVAQYSGFRTRTLTISAIEEHFPANCIQPKFQDTQSKVLQVEFRNVSRLENMDRIRGLSWGVPRQLTGWVVREKENWAKKTQLLLTKACTSQLLAHSPSAQL